jgi:hypothetical protein
MRKERPGLWFLIGLTSAALGADLAEHMIVGRVTVTIARLVGCILCFGASVWFGVPLLRWWFREPRPSRLDKYE